MTLRDVTRKQVGIPLEEHNTEQYSHEIKNLQTTIEIQKTIQANLSQQIVILQEQQSLLISQVHHNENIMHALIQHLGLKLTPSAIVDGDD